MDDTRKESSNDRSIHVIRYLFECVATEACINPGVRYVALSMAMDLAKRVQGNYADMLQPCSGMSVSIRLDLDKWMLGDQKVSVDATLIGEYTERLQTTLDDPGQRESFETHYIEIGDLVLTMSDFARMFPSFNNPYDTLDRLALDAIRKNREAKTSVYDPDCEQRWMMIHD
jgi:hypothetical protein